MTRVVKNRYIKKNKNINKAKSHRFVYPQIFDMPRVDILNHRSARNAIERHIKRFEVVNSAASLRHLGFEDQSYINSRLFWANKKKLKAFARRRYKWDRFNATVVQNVRHLAWNNFISKRRLRHWRHYRFGPKMHLIKHYFKFARQVRKSKGYPRIKEHKNPVFNMFLYYWSYLGRFFLRSHGPVGPKAKSLLYWRAAWHSQFGLSSIESLAGQVRTKAELSIGLLQGFGTGFRFSGAGLWPERWWWAKLRAFLVRPKRFIYKSSDKLLRTSIHGHDSKNGFGYLLTEAGYKRVVRSKTLDQPSESTTNLIPYVRKSIKNLLYNAKRQQSVFTHTRWTVKQNSTRVVLTQNFLHSLIWVSSFINAFIRGGAKQFIETYIQRALLFLRVYLGWIFDFSGQVAGILDKGRPIFRFVTFVRKMKKRKRKTWTVPKVLFKNKGFVFGARKLWMRLSSADDQKFIDRLVTMIEDVSDNSILDEFVFNRYEQTIKAGRLRRWMRFLRKKRKRAKLRSILPTRKWWRYGWHSADGFVGIRHKVRGDKLVFNNKWF